MTRDHYCYDTKHPDADNIACKMYCPKCKRVVNAGATGGDHPDYFCAATCEGNVQCLCLGTDKTIEELELLTEGQLLLLGQ